MLPITITDGTLRIDSLSGSNYAGGQVPFEAFSSDGTRFVLGWDVVAHVVCMVVHENKLKSIAKLKEFTIGKRVG